MPAATNSSLGDDSPPTRSARIDLSRATSCETLATESRGRPVARALSRTFAGAATQRRLLASGTATAVRSALRLKLHERVDPLADIGDDAVERFGNLVWGVTGDVLAQSGTEDIAARAFLSTGPSLRAFEHVIGHRYCGLHAKSMTIRGHGSA
jgi:hypothetical protein